jgi:hypothetical protein
MLIDSDLLETTCKNTIETILLCLGHAIKGTIYLIGPMPELQAVRITSGVREEGSAQIKWGLPGVSDYNPPGKTWEQYRDQPERALEAMAWCVEKQKSWTSDNPNENIRSVRKQVLGEMEDFHHMEPVLVSKKDLYGNVLHLLQYPVDWRGNTIWQDADYVVVAVIKIHFLPHAIARGDSSTRIIKRLSRTLGTEMLSLQLRGNLLAGQRELARQRIESCNVVAHELRNTLTKLSLAFGAINAEIAFLREQWELELRKTFPELQDKRVILERLNELIRLRIPRINGSEELANLARQLQADQKQLSALFLLPYQEDQWLDVKLQPKWDRLLSESQAWVADREEIRELLNSLSKTIWAGMDPVLAQKLTHLPEDLRTQWPRLVYTRLSPETISLLDEIIQLLQHPVLNIPHNQHTKKVFISLHALVKIIPEIEKRVNTVISCLKTGTSHEQFSCSV